VNLIVRRRITKRRWRLACHEPRWKNGPRHELISQRSTTNGRYREGRFHRRAAMATLRTLAGLDPKFGRMTRITDASRQALSTPSRRCRVGIAALCVFAFCTLHSVDASAQQDAQPQSQEAPPVATPSPPAPVSSATASWQQSLVARLAKVQRYPARARGLQGVVSLAFTIDRHGGVVSSRIVKSSGSTVLDAEALDLIKRAAPLPSPPGDIPDGDLSFVVPIRFAVP
jgi:TonB family protein